MIQHFHSEVANVEDDTSRGQEMNEIRGDLLKHYLINDTTGQDVDWYG